MPARPMAAARAPVLRHLLTCQTRTLRASHQRRWAQVHDIRFLATTQQPRSVLEKYRDKLDRKAREEGHADIDSLRAAYADKIRALRREADAVAPPAPQGVPEGGRQSSCTSAPSPPPSSSSPIPPPSQSHSQPAQSATKSPASSASSSPTGVKPLSAILDLPKASALPIKELTAVWRLRHASQTNSLCAVIPAATFAAMEAAARRNPQFVLPVPHRGEDPDGEAHGGGSGGGGGGAEMHFLQWTWDPATNSATVLFTQLAEYKARGEFAAPHTTVTHYRDLAGEKGVVLMHGWVARDRGVPVEDARWLVMCLQRFYGAWDGAGGPGGKERAEERRRLLEWFGKGDGRFSVEKLMEEAERMG